MRVLIGGKEEKTLDVLDHEALRAFLLRAVPTGDAGHHEHHHEHTHHHEHREPGHHDHHHSHHNLSDIKAIVKDLHLTDSVKADVLAVYDALAEAESRAHQKPVSEIHFHEVGNLDAIADIAAACYLIHDLAPEKIMASPITLALASSIAPTASFPYRRRPRATCSKGFPSTAGPFKGNYAHRQEQPS